MAFIDGTVVNVALPIIQKTLGASVPFPSRLGRPADDGAGEGRSKRIDAAAASQ